VRAEAAGGLPPRASVGGPTAGSIAREPRGSIRSRAGLLTEGSSAGTAPSPRWKREWLRAVRHRPSQWRDRRGLAPLSLEAGPGVGTRERAIWSIAPVRWLPLDGRDGQPTRNRHSMQPQDDCLDRTWRASPLPGRACRFFGLRRSGAFVLTHRSPRESFPLRNTSRPGHTRLMALRGSNGGAKAAPGGRVLPNQRPRCRVSESLSCGMRRARRAA